MGLHLRRKLTKWGNGFGLRITVKEAKELGLQPGQEVEADVRRPATGTDLSGLPAWDLGWPYDIDEVLDHDLVEQHGRSRR